MLNDNLRISLCLKVREWCAVHTALDAFLDSCQREDVGTLVMIVMEIDKRLADIETALAAMQPALPL